MRARYFAFALLPLMAGCALTPHDKNEALLQGPPVHEVVSPYLPALSCLAHHLSQEQRGEAFGVMNFPDRTGKVNIAANDATGTLSTQGGEDRLITALTQTGVRVVQVDPSFRALVDWELLREGGGFLGNGSEFTFNGDKSTATKAIPVLKGTLVPPDHLVSGAITEADFLPGEGGELTIAGIGGGYRQYRMLIGIDAKVTRMPTGVPYHLGGTVEAADHLQKQLVAYEVKAGVASFFSGPYYTDLNVGQDGREAIQFSEGVMLDREAYNLVSRVFGVTACDPVAAAAEGVLASRQKRGASASGQGHS